MSEPDSCLCAGFESAQSGQFGYVSIRSERTLARCGASRRDLSPLRKKSLMDKQNAPGLLNLSISLFSYCKGNCRNR